MNFIKAVLLTLILIVFNSCRVGRFFIYNFADIRDYKKFPAHYIEKPSVPFTFFEDNSLQKIVLPKIVEYKNKQLAFAEFLEKSNTIAFLIIRNDTIYYENYFNNYKRENIISSFSMAKSYVSALIGIAIDEGKIKSTEQPITDYLVQLKNKPGFEKITIQHLLDMQSGLEFDESYYNPFGDVAKYYYGTNISKYIKKLKIKSPPGLIFEYNSVNTQLLGMIVQCATGKNLSEYLQEKIWLPLGMEYDATWNIDSKKHQTEKAFCCINARARDFAKFGRLYLNKGNWNARQIVSEEWVRKSTVITMESKQRRYSNQWWHTVESDKPSGDFFAGGLLGQYIYVYPSKNVIIVRLGKSRGKNVSWSKLMRDIAKAN